MKKPKPDLAQVKAALTRPAMKAQPVPTKDLLSTGSTLLNLACSNRPQGGIGKGQFFFIVGDSSSGKTFLGMTCLAEAAKNKNFADYRLIYDNVENGALMPIEKFFGHAVAERLEPPCWHNDMPPGPRYSKYIDDFYHNINAAFNEHKPFIYILDSMDALILKADEDKFDAAENKPGAGTYGMGKAKMNSERLRSVVSRLRTTGSILIILSQTRESVDAFSFDKKTRAGGKALRFYAHIEIWSSTIEKIKKTVKGKPRVIGIMSKVQVKKNRISGHEVAVEMPIYRSFGIDDIGSCVDYLVDEGHWRKIKGGTTIEAPEMEVHLGREGLIRHIEENGLERQLRMLVATVWQEIEDQCALKRKPRYV